MRLVWLERLGVLVASLALSITLIALLSGYFTGHDPAGLSGTASQIGESFPNLGNAPLAPGAQRPRYSSDPPTSGPHVRVPVGRDEQRLDPDRLLTALAAGDVVVEYGGVRPPPGLTALASRLAGRFTPSLAASGQAVVLARRPGTAGLIGLAWTRMVRVSTSSDSLLRQFIETWLGRGARGA